MRKVDAEARTNTRNRRVGEFLQALTEGRGAEGVAGGVVTRVTIRLPTTEQPGTLIVVKASGVDGDFVSFVGGLDVCQAVLVWAAQDGGPGSKWREDRPWAGT